MLRVEIRPPENSNGWVDHAGTPINRLVFSKEYFPDYVAGHYPIESFGSLYRNIDNFRESPLQCQTDWEIKIPSIYSSSDGKVSTVDLLYWLCCANEDAKRDFDLIGCPAVLYDDDVPLYRGVVESFAGNAIRISDWLGNPKSAALSMPVALGVDEASRWQVQVSRDGVLTTLQISPVALGEEPKFYLRTDAGDLEILGFYPNMIKPEYKPKQLTYSSGWQTATFAALGEEVHNLLFSDILTQSKPTSGIFLENEDRILRALRPDYKKETPDYYTIGDGADMEVI
jgi:hypothetical protein